MRVPDVREGIEALKRLKKKKKKKFTELELLESIPGNGLNRKLNHLI